MREAAAEAGHVAVNNGQMLQQLCIIFHVNAVGGVQRLGDISISRLIIIIGPLHSGALLLCHFRLFNGQIKSLDRNDKSNC